MDVDITVLGAFSVAVDGVLVDDIEWRRRQAAALVKILSLSPRHTLHREQVMDVLWSALDIDEAAPRLHKAAFYARRALGHSGAVVLDGETVALFPHHRVRVDALAFATRADFAITTRDQAAAAQAADAYAGGLLPEDPYAQWALDERVRLHRLYVDVLRLAKRWVALTGVDPTDEEAHLQVISEMSARGDQRSALRQFERLERALRQELGVGPSPAAIAVRAKIQVAQRLTARERPPSTPRAAVPEHAVPEQNVGLPTSSMPVGRAADRTRLTNLLDTVTAGRGQTLFIAGPAGVGKTALVAWLEHTATERGLRVGSGVAAHIEGAWPYAPILEALADLSHRHPALLDGLDDKLRLEIESGLSGRPVEWAAQSGHQRLFVAAAELLRLAAAGAGAMLVVDDAHQADEASLRLLHYLARSTVSDRVLLVLAHRPRPPVGLAQVRQSLLGRHAAATLDMKPLSYEEVSTLVRRLNPAAADEFVDAVWTASEGMPFPVVELTRSGAVDGSPSAASLLPAGLTEAQVHTLAAAAIIGSTFDTDEFQELTGLPEEQAYAELDAAILARLLVRTDTGYRFRHAMLRDALLAKLLPSQFHGLHRRAAAALQVLDRSPARIGHHLIEAGDHAAAVPWVVRSAETSAALGAYHDAVATLDSVRPRAEGADLTRLLSLRADLLLASAHPSAVDAYREALAQASDPADRSRLRARLARAAMVANDLETATIALDGLVTDGSPNDTELLLSRGTLAFLQGDVEAVDAAASEMRRRVALGRPDEWQMFELVALQGFAAHNRGEWFQRLAVELRSAARHPALAARIFDGHLCVAEYVLYGPTPHVEVMELAASLRATAERAGALRAVAFATALLGETAMLIGDLESAGAELEDAVDLHRDIGSAAGEAHSLQRLAEVRLAVGDRAGANRLLQRALPIARFTSVAMHLMQRIYGTMIAAAESPEQARARIDDAEAALGVDDSCRFCDIMLAIPAARASADIGDLVNTERWLRRAEDSGQIWLGTAWQASILELKAHLASVAGEQLEARRLLRGAIELFEAAAQPLDAARCATLIGTRSA